MKTLEKALKKFQKKYPSITSTDLQTFILGWCAGNKDKESYAKKQAINFIDFYRIHTSNKTLWSISDVYDEFIIPFSIK